MTDNKISSNTRSAQIPIQSRYLGSMLGLACGDALGTTVEFCSPGTFPPVDDMKGGGPFHLKPGQWTDDTSMALCLAASLIERNGFDAADQMDRYLRWMRAGYMSSTDECFDIGNITYEALERYRRSGDPFAGNPHPRKAGNGSLMRLAPIPLFFAAEPEQAIERAADSSRTTHAAPQAVDVCRYYAGLMVGALRGEDKETLLSPFYSPVPGYWETHPLDEPVAAVAAGSFLRKEPPAIRGTGYSVDSMEAALWAFHKTDNIRDGCLLAVNLGDDADTTGAIYGQLAGAFYGVEDIPAQWRQKIAHKALIEELALKLCSLAGHQR